MDLGSLVSYLVVRRVKSRFTIKLQKKLLVTTRLIIMTIQETIILDIFMTHPR